MVKPEIKFISKKEEINYENLWKKVLDHDKMFLADQFYFS